MRNPVEDLGRTAACKIVGRIFLGEKMESEEFEPKLILRDSVRVAERIV